MTGFFEIALESAAEVWHLMAIKSHYCQPDVCVRINGEQSKSFHVSVGPWQVCVLSIIFIIYMNWKDKLNSLVSNTH